MKTAKLFQNGQSQAVRLPREFRFIGKEVYIKKAGDGVILLPVRNTWASLMNSLHKFSDDFMVSRNQPEQPERDDMFE